MRYEDLVSCCAEEGVRIFGVGKSLVWEFQVYLFATVHLDFLPTNSVLFLYRELTFSLQQEMYAHQVLLFYII